MIISVYSTNTERMGYINLSQCIWQFQMSCHEHFVLSYLFYGSVGVYFFTFFSPFWFKHILFQNLLSITYIVMISIHVYGYERKQNAYIVALPILMDVLRFYVRSYSISVITGRWEDDNKNTLQWNLVYG